jgi:hypothetical protein
MMAAPLLMKLAVKVCIHIDRIQRVNCTEAALQCLYKFFIEKHSMQRVLPSLLNEEMALGAHTNVIALSQEGQSYKYTWFHRENRPMGIEMIPQCSKCGVLNQFTTYYDLEMKQISRRCTMCKDAHLEPFPPSFPVIQGPLKHQVTQGWLHDPI